MNAAVTRQGPDDSHCSEAIGVVRDINVFSPDCPAHQLVDRIGNKWRLLVIYALTHGRARYKAVQGRVHGISPKMLTQTLRSLEKDGLVNRISYAEIPPRVEYELTELGDSLSRPLAKLCQWAEENYETLDKLWGSKSD